MEVSLTLQKQRDFFLSQAETFLDDVRKDFSGFLTEVGWDAQVLDSSPDVDLCQFKGSAHVVPLKKLEEHNQFCHLQELGYEKDEIPYLPPSPTLLKEQDKANIPSRSYSTPTDTNLTGGFHADALLELEEKLELRIKAAEAANEDSSGPKSKLEILAEMRDIRRKRQKYKIHTSKKSHTEVLRELIHNQVELLAELWEVERRLKEDDKKAFTREDMPSTSDERKDKSRSRKRSLSPSPRPEASRRSRRSRTRDLSRSRSHSPDLKKRYERKVYDEARDSRSRSPDSTKKSAGKVLSRSRSHSPDSTKKSKGKVLSMSRSHSPDSEKQSKGYVLSRSRSLSPALRKLSEGKIFDEARGSKRKEEKKKKKSKKSKKEKKSKKSKESKE